MKSFALMAATVAGVHQTFGPEDGLLIIDVQNDFLPERELPSNPQYVVDAGHKNGTMIKGGSLAVTGGDQILPVVQALIHAFNYGKGHVLASLDWHPATSCSFCSTGGTCADLGNTTCSDATKCPTSIATRCADPVSVADWQANKLYQWPAHCVQAGFGSRFDPSLVIPANATVVKKGYKVRVDSYSAYGGKQSLQGAPFDTEDTESDIDARASLKTLIENLNITRLWVVGLATDYCVKNSILDTLGVNVGGPNTAPSTVKEVVFVQSACAGVVPAQITAAIQRFKDEHVIVVPPTLTTAEDIYGFVETPATTLPPGGSTNKMPADSGAGILAVSWPVAMVTLALAN